MENITEDNTTNVDTPSNGLENFSLDEDSPNLFNSENNDEKGLNDEDNSNEFTSFDNSKEENDEDELEIPAFLRRQKN